MFSIKIDILTFIMANFAYGLDKEKLI